VRLFEPGFSLTDPVAQSEEGPVLLWPPRTIPDGPLKYVIVSPHLDDAPLSLGGRMLQWGRQCLVLDLFSTVSWWRLPIASHEDPKIQRCRDAEEDLVAELTGATIRRVGLMEAPRREYPLGEIFTADIRPDDVAGETVRAAVASLAREGDYVWFLPMAVGNHVDHRIARDSTLSALLAANAPPERIRFFEDLYYAARLDGVPDFSDFVPGRKLIVADETWIDVGLKMTLLRAYWSQLTLSQIVSVGEYARRIGSRPVERTWNLEGLT
jgi:LmbE family N-acetylglucosaminyl deacetylase